MLKSITPEWMCVMECRLVNETANYYEFYVNEIFDIPDAIVKVRTAIID